VDEYGSVQGMVTLNDILEAIVGDLPQETKGNEEEIIMREDGTYLVDAQVQFYDFLIRFEKTDWMEEEQDFDTLAGFILQQLERIPHTGDHLEWKGFRFEIVDMDAQRIDKVLVTLSPEMRQELEDNS
jgi:putative hemolysin